MTRMRTGPAKGPRRTLLTSRRAPRVVRFAISGGLVAALSVSVVTVLVLAGAPAQVALLIAYTLALALHFTLNRAFVFATQHGYALELSAQGRRYLVVALISYALTALSLALVPAALDAPRLPVYYATAAILAVVNFLVLRRWVFGADAVRVEGRASG